MITGNLEYLMSSLPHLSFQDTDEEKAKVISILNKYAGPSTVVKNTMDILEDEADKFLSPKKNRIFQQITLEKIHSETYQKSKNQVLAAFASYLFSLKKDVQQLRISRKNGMEPSVIKKHPLSLQPGNPLEKEIQLLKWQWEKLEELGIEHYADFGALCIYKLKLFILLRWWSFDQEIGFANFLYSTKKTEDG